jgi:hypothetical protein
MKYELDEGKFADGEYAEWFSAFNESLINEMFDKKCQSVMADMSVIEENLDSARSIKDIGVNFDY